MSLRIRAFDTQVPYGEGITDFNHFLPRAYAWKIPDEGRVLLEAVLVETQSFVSQGNARNEINEIALQGFLRSIHTFLDLDYEFNADACSRILSGLWTIMQGNLTMSVRARVLKVMTRLLHRAREVGWSSQWARATFGQPLMDFSWKTLYELLEENHFRQTRADVAVGSQAWNFHLCSLVRFGQILRKFIPEDKGDEVFETIKPLLDPYKHVIFRAQAYLGLFMPNASLLRYVPEIMRMWDWMEECSSWDVQWFTMLNRAAKADWYTGRQFDWSPYLPIIFTKILRGLNMPSGRNTNTMRANRSYPAECRVFFTQRDRGGHLARKMGKLIVYLCGPLRSDDMQNTVKESLDKLLKAIAPYVHPSNGGRWSPLLGSLLRTLCSSYNRRIHREQQPQCIVPAQYKLDKQDNSNFLAPILPLLLQGIYAKQGTMVALCEEAFKHAVVLAPEDVLTPLVDRVLFALETVTETHQTLIAIKLLSVMTRALIRYSPQHLPAILNLTLPGIDPSDPFKTMSTLSFHATVLSFVPIVDSTQSSIDPDKLSESQQEARSATSALSDWAFLELEQILMLLTHQDKPEKHGSGMAGIDSGVTMLIHRLVTLLFMQMSEDILSVAVRKVVEFMTTSLLPNAIKSAGVVVSAVTHASPALSLQLFIPHFEKRLFAKNGKELAVLSSSELLWDLHLLGSVLRKSGKAALQYKETVERIVLLCLEHEDKTVQKEAGKAFRRFLQGMSEYYIMDYRCLPSSLWNDKQKREAHFLTWGQPWFENISPNWKPTDLIAWHEPSPEERAYVFELTEKVLNQALNTLKSVGLSSDPKDVQQVIKAIHVIRNVLRGTLSLWPDSRDSEAQPSVIAIGEDRVRSETAEDTSVRGRVGMALCELCEKLMNQVSTQVESTDAAMKEAVAIGEQPTTLRTALKAFYLVLTSVGVKHSRLSSSIRMSRYLREWLSDSKGFYPESTWQSLPMLVWQERVSMQHNKRMMERSYGQPRSVLRCRMIGLLGKLAMYGYSRVRRKAQAVLTGAVRRHPGSVGDFVPQISQELSAQFTSATKEQQEATVTGAIYLMTNKTLLRRFWQDWGNVAIFIKNLCGSSHHDKDTVQARISSLFYSFIQNRQLIPLTPGHIDSYLNLLDSIVNIVLPPTQSAAVGAGPSSSKLHWRYQVMATACLVILLRHDAVTPTPSAKVWAWVIEVALCEIVPLRKLGLCGLNVLLTACHIQRTNPPEEILARLRSAPFVKALFTAVAADHKLQAADYSTASQSQDAIDQVLKEIMRSEFTWPRTRASRVSDQFVVEHAKLIKHLLEVAGTPIYSALFEPLQAVCNEVKDREIICGAAEISAGIVRGIDHWPQADRNSVLEMVLPIINNGLEHASPETVPDWVDAIRFMTDHCTPETLLHVYNLLAGGVSDLRSSTFVPLVLLRGNDAESSYNIARRLKLLQALLLECLRGQKELLTSLLPELKRAMSHPYKQVREEVGRTLFIIYRCSWNPHDPLVESTALLKDFIADTEASLKAYVASREDAASPSSAADAPAEGQPKQPHSALGCHLESTIYWSAHGCISGESFNVLPYVLRFLAHFFKSQLDPDFELAVLSKHTVTQIATMPMHYDPTAEKMRGVSHAQGVVGERVRLHPSLLDECLGTAGAAAASWHIRLSALNFIETTVAGHRLLLTSAEEDMIYERICGLLADVQPEVREAAVRVLSTLSMSTSEARMTALSQKFSDLVGVVQRRKQAADKQPNPQRDANLRTGILGLSALVLAFPYDVPQWMPALIEKLTRFSGSSHGTEIQNVVRKTLSEFRRTHQDSWRLFKERFTDEQLEALNDSVVAPSYFA
eukprot:GILK01005788.1.p1 GENE.GILK01005788.1~~GILK01005788.1.p1  ORF type:complete len:1828 (-),score=234.09 GILK01005788.1:70-5553(-)